MKKVLILLLILTICLSAQEAKPDTASTRISISDIKFYDVIQPEEIRSEEELVTSDKPFALIQPGDKWFSKDKWMHFSSAYFLTLQSSYAMEKMFLTEAETSRYVSVGVTLTVSLGKEFFDVFNHNGIFSWKDLAYDVLGTGLGYLTVLAIQK